MWLVCKKSLDKIKTLPKKMNASNKMNKLIDLAAETATQSCMMRKHGALLLSKSGKLVLGSACNTQERTCIRGSSERESIHAEVGSLLSSRLRKRQFKRGLRTHCRERGQQGKGALCVSRVGCARGC